MTIKFLVETLYTTVWRKTGHYITFVDFLGSSNLGRNNSKVEVSIVCTKKVLENW